MLAIQYIFLILNSVEICDSDHYIHEAICLKYHSVMSEWQYFYSFLLVTTTCDEFYRD